MRAAPQHVYQVFTKRTRRMAEWSETHHALIGSNVWLGTSIENQNAADERLPWLRRTHARVRSISAEPLLGPLELDLSGVHWVIVGGESGPRARPMDLNWARGVRDACILAGAAFFLKQLGGVRDKRGRADAVLDGQRWMQYPADGASF